MILIKKRAICLFAFIFSVNIVLSQGQGFGNITGKVINLKNNEPLPFVNVGVVGTSMGASTDDDGVFLIKNVPVGFYKLTSSCLGFNSTSSEEFKVINTKTIYVEIKMRESDVSLDEVTVTVNTLKRNDKAPVSMKSIGLQEIENSPGANRDIAKVIQNLPGVANMPALNRNDIFIRGGAGNEAKFYLDDIEIPNINHFATQGSTGGTNGILNADFMREVKFYSASFPASKAGALSAVFDFKQIDGNKDKLKLRTSIGASEVSLVVDGPIGDKTTFICSVRRSYLQLLFKLIGLPFLPTFNDYQVKVKHKIDSKNELSFISIGSLDYNRLDTDMKKTDELQQYILDYLPEQNQWSYALGTVWKHFYKNGYSTLVLSRNMLMNKSYKYENNNKSEDFLQNNKSSQIENKLRWENTIYLPNNFDLNVGVGGQYVKYNNEVYRKLFILDTIINVDLNNSLKFFKYSAFVQLDKSFFSDKLKTSIGYRMLGNTYADYMYNPLKQNSLQAKLSYSFSPKISAHVHVGRFFQLPSYTSLGYRNKEGELENKTNKLGYIHADHLVAGVELYPYENGLITLEGFYKKYYNYPFSVTDKISLAHRDVDFGIIGNESLVSESEGRAWGIELLSQNRLPNNINMLISYTFSVSEFLHNQNDWLPTAWDNRHIFIFTFMKKFKYNWDIGLKWRFAGGLPYTPYDLERSRNKIAWDIRHRAYFDYKQLMSQRLRPFHQLDVRINKSFFIKNTELKLYIDVQNAYNFKAECIDYYTNRDAEGQEMINSSDPTLYDLRPLNNNGTGTVIPTIGVIFDF